MYLVIWRLEANMSIRVSSITLALLLIVNSVVIAETTTQYVRNDNEVSNVEIILEADVVDDDTILEFPNAEVLDASYVVSGGDDGNGNYPEDIQISVSNSIWQYSGDGYGALGLQNDFSGGSTTSSAVFTDDSGGETTVELYIPVNATITDAEVSVEGLPKGTGELDDYRLVSKDTNGGSFSTDASTVIDGNDIYAIWLDDGDLEKRENAYYNVLFNSKTSSSWDDPIVIASYSEELYIFSDPLIRGNSDLLLVSWQASGYLQYTYSTDEGETWSDIQIFDPWGDIYYYVYYYDFDIGVVIDDDDEEVTVVHATWTALRDDGDTTDYRVYHSYSEDLGETWSSEVEVSDTGVATNNVYPKMDFDQYDVHISWVGVTSSNSIALYSKSDDGGDSFNAPTQLSGTSDAGVVDISCDDNNIVIVTWSEGDGDSKKINARTSSNSGSTFNTEITLSSADDAELWDEVEITTDMDGNFYVIWPREDTSEDDDIVVSRSPNSGTSWNSAVEVDGIDGEGVRGSASISATSDKLVVVWTDDYDGDGTSSDLDIYSSESSNDGSSWTTAKEIGSDQYYEADSSAVALAYSNSYLYALYIDGGDNDPDGDTNGNDASNTDGDVFFRRSSNDGEDWDNVVVISNEDTDGHSYETFDYASYFYSYYRAAISASGNDVYAAWCNYDRESGQYQIKFSSSSNSGTSWSEPIILSSDDTNANSYAPAITSSGDEVYVAWQERYDTGTTFDYNIITKTSDNNGDSWDSAVTVTSNDGTNYIPELAYSNNIVHLTWHAYSKEVQGQYTIEYANSDDQGQSWTRTALRTPDSTADFAWFPNIDTDGSYVYVIWQDDGNEDGDDTYDWDVVGIVSDDNGETWSDPHLIADSGNDNNNYYTLPAVASANGFAYVTYQETDGSNYEHRFVLTQDNGETWSESFPVNDGHVNNYAKMDLAIDDKAYFAYYEDNDRFDEEHDDFDIVLRATLEEGYPTNPTINLDGGSDDWEWPGEINQDNSPVVWDSNGENGALKSFKDAIKDGLEHAIDNGDTFVDNFGVEMAIVTLTVTSDTDGRLGFSNMIIEYDVDLTVKSQSLKEKLNTLVDSTSDSESTVETKFTISSSTNGKLILKDLSIVTAEADLEITSIEFSDNNPKEGSSIVISAYVENSGEGDANVDVQFFIDGEEVETLSKIEGISSGDTGVATYTWRDLPVGNHQVKAEIVNSVPEDKSEGNDIITKAISIEEANPEITTEFYLDGIPVQDESIDWYLAVKNVGDKYGNVIVYLYENNEDDDNLIYESPLTKIAAGEEREFDAENEYTWDIDETVTQFFLKVWDADSEEILNGEGNGENIPIDVQRFPVFTISKIEWVDDNDELITSFSDGTEAYAKIYILNGGSFDVTGTVEISLTKSDKKITPTPNYGANIEFNADTETVLMINGEYPRVNFNSEEQSGFTGSWTVDIKIKDIFAKNSEEQIWDSEELIFSDNTNRVLVALPPDLALTQFTSSDLDINEGDAVTFTLVVTNDGEAEATGNILLKQGQGLLGTIPFTVGGYDSVSVKYEYSVPDPYDGELTLRAQIDSYSVYPPGGPSDSLEDDFQTITLDVEGTTTAPSGESGSSTTGSLIVPLVAGGVLLAGLGGAFFLYKRSQMGGELGTEDSDPFGTAPPAAVPEQPPVAPPAPTPEQPPVAPPAPAPEQPPVAPPAPAPEQPPATPPAAAPGETVLTVAVPEGAQPGQQIQIKAPDGRLVTVAVPAGMQPGQQFQIKV